MYTLTTSEEKKRKDYAFWRQFIEKPSIITGGDCSFEKIVMTHTHGSHLMCCLYVKLLVRCTVHFCLQSMTISQQSGATAAKRYSNNIQTHLRHAFERPKSMLIYTSNICHDLVKATDIMPMGWPTTQAA